MSGFDKEIQALETVKEMLIDRGYTLEEDSKEDFIVKGRTSKHTIICFICKLGYSRNPKSSRTRIIFSI